VPIWFDYFTLNAKKVELRGSWDGWKAGLHLKRLSSSVFGGDVYIPHGHHEYKYIIDGSDWRCDLSRTNESTGSNNILDTSAPLPEVLPGVFKDLTPARKVLNQLHTLLGEQFPKIYVHQQTEDIAMVIRHDSTTHKNFVLVARSAFWEN
jgi:hypothetical protein